jgi:hypothetical protein
MNQQLYRGDSVNVSKTGTFIDLSDLLLDSPKKSKFKKFKSFLYKKRPKFIKDLLILVIPITIVIGSIILICFII